MKCFRCQADPCKCPDGQTVYVGDCREVLRLLPDESVNCCVTSPPYWGLRDYQVEASAWGGDLECEHEWGDPERTTWANDVKGPNGGGKNGKSYANMVKVHGQWCGRCGAWLGCLGLEPSPDLFVDHLTSLMSEVRRVLTPDGTLWLNLGDSYAGSWGAQGRQGASGQMASRSVVSARQIAAHPQRMSGTGRIPASLGLKPKDLIGVPWRAAFGLQADGWYLRQDIIWHKPNPMPESVTDRCTKAHEYIFLFSRSERYHFNQDAIRQEPSGISGGLCFGGKNKGAALRDQGIRVAGREFSQEDRDRYMTEGCNKRSVWTVTTKPYKAAHFATFPPDLIEPCILAGCPEGGVCLDPFVGSGTTLQVARKNGCRGIGIELNPEYAKLVAKRLEQRTLFTESA